MSTADIVAQLLRLIAAIAPGVLAAAMSNTTDKEAIARMVERVERLPARGGASGADAVDLAGRKRG